MHVYAREGRGRFLSDFFCSGNPQKRSPSTEHVKNISVGGILHVIRACVCARGEGKDFFLIFFVLEIPRKGLF